MKAIRSIIDRPETIAIPLVRWMESHRLMTAEILCILITIATFLEMAG